MAAIDPLTAAGVVLATAATDAVYVMFTSAVVARKRVSAAGWSSPRYVLSSYAVISYTDNWILCGIRRDRLVARRVRVDHFRAPAGRRSADRRGAAIARTTG
jgi:hypothetical protein